MKPIKYILRKHHNFIQCEDEIIDKEWVEKDFYSYQPEWLEKVYDGGNKHQLATHNNQLQYYMNHKEEYTYVATWKNINDSCEHYVEYYYIDDNTIIGYYSEKYKGYDRDLRAIMIWVKKEAAKQ